MLKVSILETEIKCPDDQGKTERKKFGKQIESRKEGKLLNKSQQQ